MEKSDKGFPTVIGPERINWKHYFGGFGFIAIILQLLTGLFLIFFYDPTLENAYKSIQYISNKLFMGSLARNLHRWIPVLLVVATIVHTVRSFLRSDYRKKSKKVLWLTGVLLIMPLFLFLVTGLIIPWEWKGYWFMGMIPNYFETVPVIGPQLKAFFIDTFTIPRYYAVHVVLLPLITIVLIDYHILAKLRRRGIFRYLLKHTVIAIPLIVILILLAVKVTIPSNDPVEIPMPLEGEWIPEPEWYFLTILLPFMYVKGVWLPALLTFAPLLLFIAFAFMPYYLKSHEKEAPHSHQRRRHNALVRFWHRLKNTPMKRKIVNAVIVTLFSLFLNGLFYLGSYKSPTLGCNSCHNTYRGVRMGVPPEDFKDRTKVPVLDDNEWMMGHWYYPNEIW